LVDGFCDQKPERSELNRPNNTRSLIILSFSEIRNIS
jgi:hypothetical protein